LFVPALSVVTCESFNESQSLFVSALKLSITQVPDSEGLKFQAVNITTMQFGGAVRIPSPYEWPVSGAGIENLMVQLRWLLEVYLEHPFEPNITRAEKIEAALKTWGTVAFNALFDNRAAGTWFPSKVGSEIEIIISCDDPELLAWPWEALHDVKLGFLGQQTRIQRRLSRDMPEPPDLPPLPEDRINILLITARPFENDVGYRSVSRPLVDLIDSKKLPAMVHALRPPTLENLVAHLEERKGFYHIIHFDGHGGYGSRAIEPPVGPFQRNEGRLLFENEVCEPREVTASELAGRLQGVAVPFFVLNACRSAYTDKEAKEGRAFASVAGALSHAGFRSVLAMAYNLTVSGAQLFLPDFYQELFKNGNFLEATRKGRITMSTNRVRSSYNKDAKLPDWVLPVVYQGEDYILKFATYPVKTPERVQLPPETLLPSGFKFVGRDEAIQSMERALRGKSAGILIHGLGGIGKTTLAKHFLQWIRDTGGLAYRPFWFSFDNIHSAGSVFNQIGRSLFDSSFDSDRREHFATFIQKLREETSLILVWDNFESVRGLDLEGASCNLNEPDRERLRNFLRDLRGGKTKVLITSRSDETWLPRENCRRLHLGGLHGEDRWDYAAEVMDTLGLNANRKDADLLDLLNDLEGHPILIQAVLARLTERTASELKDEWRSHLLKRTSAKEDPEHARFWASLELASGRFLETDFVYLNLIGLHERYIDLDYMNAMGGRLVESEKPLPYKPSRAEDILNRLARGGLLTRVGQNVFWLHPLLSTYLREIVLKPSSTECTTAFERAFVDCMASLADSVAPKQLHEQRGFFLSHQANCRRGLELAERAGLYLPMTALIQVLALYSQRTRNFVEAMELFTKLAENHCRHGNSTAEAGAYHHLGLNEQAQENFAAAERWYSKARSILERLGDEMGAAAEFFQLGIIAHERRDFAAANHFHLKSLEVFKKNGSEREVANTYHELGMTAGEERDFVAAKDHFLNALGIWEKIGDQHGAALTYQALGLSAYDQHDFVEAQQWYLKSLSIKEKQGNEQGAAFTYHNLGMISYEQGDLAAAERWHLKSLAIKEKQRDENGAAASYHELGRIAKAHRGFSIAERWFMKALTIFQERGNEYALASVFHQLGIVAQEQEDLAAADKWYAKSLAIDEKLGDRHSAARMHAQLGLLAEQRAELLKAGSLLLKSIALFNSLNDPHFVEKTLTHFVRVYGKSSGETRTQLKIEGEWTLGAETMRRIEEGK
jgi:tetratricopeptide (TPR) repeat protein